MCDWWTQVLEEETKNAYKVVVDGHCQYFPLSAVHFIHITFRELLFLCSLVYSDVSISDYRVSNHRLNCEY
jgi:hypothetical protein